MTEIFAKQIIKDQFWILIDGDKKVGNIEATTNGFGVKLNGNSLQFDSTAAIQSAVNIKFVTTDLKKQSAIAPKTAYPIVGKIHDMVTDIPRKMTLYTKSKNSKIVYAAGWFMVNFKGTGNRIKPTVVLCPKNMFLERYTYVGPFKTKAEAAQVLPDEST